jgi:outer membrane lipase/esterase
MKMLARWLKAVLPALALAACGGSDPYVAGSTPPAGAPTTKISFTSVVSFGDSLSDAGAYAPATSLAGNGSAPYLGGKFTTNSAMATVWVENIATALGLPLTPHEVGAAGQSLKCPAAAVSAALANSCTAYGQGGARVSDANGIGRSAGLLTVPLKTQIANHLQRFGNFKGSELVLVLGGSNDVFVQFEAFVAAATKIQTDAALGRITPDQASGLLLAAQLASQEALKQAAGELSGYIKTELLAKGAKYVAVGNLPDSAGTPFGASLPANVQPVLTGLSEIFNLWLREGLSGQPVQILDIFSFFKEARANPAKYGMSNVSVPACDAAKIAVISGGRISDGSSLFCNATPGLPYNGLRTGADVSTWFFADGVHPTTGGHKVFSDEVLRLLRGFGWL